MHDHFNDIAFECCFFFLLWPNNCINASWPHISCFAFPSTETEKQINTTQFTSPLEREKKIMKNFNVNMRWNWCRKFPTFQISYWNLLSCLLFFIIINIRHFFFIWVSYAVPIYYVSFGRKKYTIIWTSVCVYSLLTNR